MPATTQKGPLHPQVLWAQRDMMLFVTVSVDDMKIDDLTFDDKSMHIKGTSGSAPHQDYECKLDFCGEIDASKYRRISSSRHVELVIPKSAKGWWPRLLKDASKVPWIKVDFNKWKDEDDDESMGGGAPGMGGGDSGFDFSNYMANMGGSGGGGGPPNMDDFDESDNEDMPDLEDEPGEKGGSEDKSDDDNNEAAATEHVDKPKKMVASNGDEGSKKVKDEMTTKAMHDDAHVSSSEVKGEGGNESKKDATVVTSD